MTKTYKEVQYTHTGHELESATCDWCGVTIPAAFFRIDDHHTYEFSLAAYVQTGYPDGSAWRGGWQVQDLCAYCQLKLKKLLTENGVKITEFDDE